MRLRGLTEASLVHRDEPLLGGAEDNRLLAPPAVRVRVGDAVLTDERTLALQPLGDLHVVAAHLKALERTAARIEEALIVDRHRNRQVVLNRQQVILGTVPARAVHRAGSGREVDVRIGDDPARALIENGVGVGQLSQLRPLELRAYNLVVTRFPAQVGDDGLQERLGEDEYPTARTHADVVGLGVQRHEAVRRNRPRSSGPDEHADGLTVRGVIPRGGHVEPVHDVYSGRGLVTVLNLRLSQRGLTAHAPVNRLAASVDSTVKVHLLKDLDVASLVVVVQGKVRIVPVTQNAEAAELTSLDIDEVQCPVTAPCTELSLRDGRHLLGAQVLLNHVFDGLTVAVPAGNVR